MEKLEPSIVVLVNPFEVAQNPELYNVSRRMLLAHVPSPALPVCTYEPAGTERPIDLLLLGAVHQYYPLRLRWSEMLRQRHHLGLSEFNIHWRKHPGHFVQQNHAQQHSEYVATLEEWTAGERFGSGEA